MYPSTIFLMELMETKQIIVRIASPAQIMFEAGVC